MAEVTIRERIELQDRLYTNISVSTRTHSADEHELLVTFDEDEKEEQQEVGLHFRHLYMSISLRDWRAANKAVERAFRNHGQ